MLIIAIPRSASTSLMVTFAKLHHIPCRQIFAETKVEIDIAALRVPPAFKPISFHTDVREYTMKEVAYFVHPEKVYKQHIPPTTNNVRVFKGHKKVILLRDPKDIILSYRRAHILRRQGFTHFGCEKSTGVQCIKKATSNGTLAALRRFYRGWLEAQDKNCCVVTYRDVIKNTNITMNRIERFFGLPVSQYMVLAKERYTRGQHATITK